MYNGCTICRSIVGDKTWSHIAARFASGSGDKTCQEDKTCCNIPFSNLSSSSLFRKFLLLNSKSEKS